VYNKKSRFQDHDFYSNAHLQKKSEVMLMLLLIGETFVSYYHGTGKLASNTPIM
jgi:hypothetical protein